MRYVSNCTMFISVHQFGRTALEAVMKSVMSLEKPMAPLPKDYKGNFFEGKIHYSVVCVDASNVLIENTEV